MAKDTGGQLSSLMSLKICATANKTDIVSQAMKIAKASHRVITLCVVSKAGLTIQVVIPMLLFF